MNLINYLRGGRQCDSDGTEIIMSRQACHEAADKLIAADAMAVSAENFIQAIDDLLCIADADLDDEGVADAYENAVEAKYQLKSMISDFRK